jgi:photosystem II stability/assembly factor-like uncharacterized protein
MRRQNWTLALIVTLASIISALMGVNAGGSQADPGDTGSLWRGAVLPASQPLAWVHTAGPPGGLGYDIRYDFADPNTWFVTDNFSGVHKSTDNGIGWFPSNTGIPKQAGPSGDWRPVFSLTVDPHDSRIVWAGTDLTGHIYRSTDGGVTWEQRDNGIVIEHDLLTFRGFTVDPMTSDTIYAMAETLDLMMGGKEIWGNGNGGAVYRTTDAGANWVKIWDGGMPSALARYLWINPRDPANLDDDILFVSTGIFDRSAIGQGDPLTDVDALGGLGILRSTDSGQTWEVLNEAHGLQMLYIGSLFMHPRDPDTLFAAAGHEVGPVQAAAWQAQGSSPAGVYRTTDAGDTWAHVLAPPVERAGEEFSAVEVCTLNPDVVYAGSARAIYRSLDGGLTWVLRAGGAEPWGPPGVRAGWPIDLQCDPRDTDRIFANNYQGGNFLSEDGGQSWQNASRGYTGAQLNGIAVDPNDAARVYAQGRSGPWRSRDAGHSWAGLRYPPEDGLSRMNEGTMIATAPDQPLLVFTNDVDSPVVLRSTDGGGSWHAHLLPAGIAGPVVALAFAPSAPETIYGGVADPGCHGEVEPCPAVGVGLGVVVSHDRGQSWQWAVDADLEAQHVLRLAVHPGDAEVVYAAAGAGGLFRTTDGGADWTALAIADLPRESEVRAIAIDPADPRHLLAGIKYPGIYASFDGGQSWQWSGAGLEPNSIVADLVFDPANVQTVYAADLTSGVYRSTNGGQSWQAVTRGMETRSVVRLALSGDSRHLYAATNGNGVYRLDLNGAPPAVWRFAYLPLALRAVP